MSNKNLDDDKKEFHFLNTSKLLFVKSFKLLLILLILISFLLGLKFINPTLFEIFFHIENFLKITIIIVIYNFLRNKFIDERL